MALTKNYRETVLERIQSDPEFTSALYAEAIAALVQGDQATTLSILRDLVHAHVTFKSLAYQTGFGEKALHRMLGAHGNPTSENLAQIIHAVEKTLNLDVEITVRQAPASRKKHPSPTQPIPAVVYA